MGKNFNDLTLPCIMGILNVTPDSFSDGNKYFIAHKAIERLHTIIDEGATIVDIGGESTKPGITPISPAVEWKRIETVIEEAVAIDKICVSVDTYHPETAKLALKKGVNIINDVCGIHNFHKMAKLVKDFDAHLILTHNSRLDKNFHKISDPLQYIISEFEKILQDAEKINFDPKRIIFDPGIGFGKSHKQNLEIFKNLHVMCSRFYSPIICATSKKSFLQTLVKGDSNEIPSDRELLGATVATTVDAVHAGCKIFRVHDIAENLAALKMALS